MSQRSGTASIYWRVAIRPHLTQAVSIMLLMVLSAILDVITVGMTVPLFDLLTHSDKVAQGGLLARFAETLRYFGFPSGFNAIIFSLLVFVSVLFIVHSVFSLIQQYWTALIAHHLRREMKSSLFSQIMTAQYEDATRHARGTLVNDINNAADSIYLAIISLGHLFTGFFNSLLMISLMLVLSWWATLIIGGMVFVSIFVWRRIADLRAAQYGRWIYDLRRDQAKLEVDAIDGLKVVKAHGIEQEIVGREMELVISERRPTGRLVLLRQGPTLVNEIAASFIVLGFGAITFLFPSFGMRFSLLVAFLLSVRRIAPALAEVNSASVELNRAKRGIEVVEELAQQLPPERTGGLPIARVEEIQLAGVSFAYRSRPEHQVLERIDITMKRGQVTAIVGSTGSGKSTVANLIVGLYEPRSGSVRVNGVDLKRLDLASWRRQIGYVAQDIFVFNASIRENIALGREIPFTQIEWVSRVAQMDQFIESLPQGYETVVGDRGLRLSGGQCQRLAIALALLKRPDVLILDEATSALDNLTERAVYGAINSMRSDSLVVVIAHRLSTVKDADQIVVLKSGRVVEQGTHDLLMKGLGVYAGLYEETYEKTKTS